MLTGRTAVVEDGVYEKVAQYWTTYKDVEFTSEDVAKMIELLNLAQND